MIDYFFTYVNGIYTFVGVFFGAPISLLLETREIMLIDSKTTGVITESKEVPNGDCDSSVFVRFQFQVDGKIYQSSSVFPGFLGNSGGYSGNSRITKEFPIGKKIPVFYDRSNPNQNCLKYGWYCWSVAFTLLVWGTYFPKVIAPKNAIVVILGKSVVIYGGCLIFLGPLCVEISHLHLHLMVLAVISLCTFVHFRIKNRRAENEPDAEKVMV